jgi:hypothetical protein
MQPAPARLLIILKENNENNSGEKMPLRKPSPENALNHFLKKLREKKVPYRITENVYVEFPSKIITVGKVVRNLSEEHKKFFAHKPEHYEAIRMIDNAAFIGDTLTLKEAHQELRNQGIHFHFKGVEGNKVALVPFSAKGQSILKKKIRGR